MPFILSFFWVNQFVDPVNILGMVQLVGFLFCLLIKGEKREGTPLMKKLLPN